VVVEKMFALSDYCEQHGLDFEIWTEEEME